MRTINTTANMTNRLNKGHFLANYEHCVDKLQKKIWLITYFTFSFKKKTKAFLKKQFLGPGSGGAPL